MVIDSLYEGVTPVNRLYGVSRLNTRFSFYVYSTSKLSSSGVKYVPQSVGIDSCESIAIGYVFK